MTRRNDLSTPRQRRRVGLHYDPDAFGQFSETIARTLGTARFLVWQSGLIILWFGYNFVAPGGAKFDDPAQGWVRLTMVLSLQAAYAAPLILLAQNRQEQRDRSLIRRIEHSGRCSARPSGGNAERERRKLFGTDRLESERRVSNGIKPCYTVVVRAFRMRQRVQHRQLHARNAHLCHYTSVDELDE